MSKDKSQKLILWFAETDRNDLPLVGGKSANLGELTKMGAPVPDGFTVTATAYFDMLERGSLKKKIQKELVGLDTEDSTTLEQASAKIKAHIIASKIPPQTEIEIRKAYRKLSGVGDILVAVRSSATAEDLPEASFAGQQETYLNIKGEEDVLKAVRSAWASLFTARAIFYRESHGFDHITVGLAVPVQRMVAAEVSGVMFTLEPLTNDRKKILIEAVYGLGEGIVQGMFTPDRYVIKKNTLEILDKYIAKQPFQIAAGGRLPVSKAFETAQKLPNKYIKQVAEWGRKIEEHYEFPQDIEWVFSHKKVYVVQTRPVTTIKDIAPEMGEEQAPTNEKGVALLAGIGAAPGEASGAVKILSSSKELAKIKKGDILVTKMTNPDFVPAMKRAAAIVTDQGGMTSHAAIVSRELGVPCVVGTKEATAMLTEGEIITVVGSEGKVYAGDISLKEAPKVEKETPRAGGVVGMKTATKIYVNLGQTDLAKEVAAMDVDGVGLLRAEFMFAEIGSHPRHLIKTGKKEQLTDRLYEGLLQMTKAFAPRPVIYRTNDFKTSEYRNLKGGAKFEGEETNPMLGFRGASRYIADPEVFKIELEAIKKVRRYRKNLWVMIPFVRTPEELIAVKKIMNDVGLHRGGSFKLWLMVEIPANVILLEKFIGVGIDGVSIGSNDLTQLTLGVDRDNAKLNDSFDEQNDAVTWMIKETIHKAAAHGISSSICGQAPSQYPQMVKNLVEWGITSISVSPDAIEKTRKLVYEAEREVVNS